MYNKNIFLKDNIRPLFLAIAILSFGSVGMALIGQYKYDMQPCAWCVLQRLIFMVIGVFSLVFSFFPTLKLKRMGLATVSAISIIGVFTAAYQFLIASSSIDCNISVAEKIIYFTGLSDKYPEIFGIYALCGETNPMVYGVPFVILSLVMFLMLNHVVLSSLIDLKRINQIN